MPALATPLRKDLEKAVIQARKVAERGAAASLIALGYAEPDKPVHLSADDAALRTALRARGRQLGEAKGETGVQQGQQPLTGEIAYEQWHRMLFARFLAENGLLRHPEGASLTIEMCAELAPEEGARDGWDLAARYAGAMLPGLFRASDPAVRVRLAREHYLALEELVEGLPEDVFSSDDGLGWVYQFWQTERKKQVNAEAKSRGTKIGAAELPAVTQLFTEPYMVDFLLQNTLGAWWAGKYPDSPLLAEMPYLRWAEDAPGPNEVGGSAGPGDSSPGSGTMSLSGVPESNMTVGDIVPEPGPFMAGHRPQGDNATPATTTTPRRPAAGTFDGWAKTVAELKVLDPCCGSGHFLVAAFGWLRRMREAEDGLSKGDAADAVLRDNLFGLELDRRCTQIARLALSLAAHRAGGNPVRHPPKLGWSGAPIRGQREQWLNLAGNDQDAIDYIDRLYHRFERAPLIGSLNPGERDLGTFMVSPRRVADESQGRLWHTSEAVRRRIHARIDRYTKESSAEVSIFADNAAEVLNYVTMLAESYDLVVSNFPFLSRSAQHEDLREFADDFYPASKADLATLLMERSLELSEGGGTVAAVTPQNWLFLNAYRKLREDVLVGRTLDVIARLGTRAFETVSGEVVNVALVALTAQGPLPDAKFAGIDVSEGKGPADKDRLLQELPVVVVSQSAQEQNPDGRIALSTSSNATLLETYSDSIKGLTTGDLLRFVQCFWEIQVRDAPWSRFQGPVNDVVDYGGREAMFYWCDGKGPMQDVPGSRTFAKGAWGKAGILISQMRDLPATRYSGDPHDDNTAVLVPKDLGHLPAIWAFCSSPEFNKAVRRIDTALKVTNATLVKVPFDLDHWTEIAAAKYPDGLPEPHSDDPTQWLFTGHPKGSDDALHVALARLLGYRWPEQPENDHGLREYIDPDGIVCLPAVAGEQPAHLRLRELLRAAWATSGEATDWDGETVAELLAGAGSPGKTLEDWLRDDAFRQHCALFHNRPFLWHVWDGRKDGFTAIVNYHRLDAAMLDKLTYTYLGDWIGRQKQAAEASVPGADARWQAALALQRKLELIRQGEAPYDIYVRWKSLAQQPIGWEPDLDDGVRLNVRPFVEAGVLRTKFTVKWGKDRGANPEGADVYRWSEAAQRAAGIPIAEVNGKDRLNDLHLSLATKQAAREEAEANPEVDAAPTGPRSLLG